MENLITHKDKQEIIKLTNFLSNSYSQNNKTDLLGICNDEGLKICVDDYENYFDGMLVWDKPNFYIHLNSFKGNFVDSKRGRFTLSHELGHFFIDAHREGMKMGILPTHASNQALYHSDKMEAEADYFASALIMPRERLRQFTAKRKFSLEIIREISEDFGVSLTSAALRFAEVGTHEIMVVFCENNHVKWYKRSDDFPKIANRFKIGGAIPPTTVVGESFLKSDAKYTTIEMVDIEDWFYYQDWAPKQQLFEQCFYSDIYNYTISLVWFK